MMRRWLRRPRTLRGMLMRMATIVLVVSLAIWYGSAGMRARNLVRADAEHRPDYCSLPQGPCPQRQWAAFPELQAHRVQLPLENGIQLRGWYLPSANGRLVVLFHDYRANASALLPLAAAIHGDGTGVLAFDLPGHGRSGGERIALDLHSVRLVKAIHAYALQLPDILPTQIAVAGDGLGAAMALTWAMQSDPAPAMVMVSRPLLVVDLDWVKAHTGLPAALAWWVLQRLKPLLDGQDYNGAALREGRPALRVPLMWLSEPQTVARDVGWLDGGVDRSRVWIRLFLPADASPEQQARQLQALLGWMRSHWPEAESR